MARRTNRFNYLADKRGRKDLDIKIQEAKTRQGLKLLKAVQVCQSSPTIHECQEAKYNILLTKTMPWHLKQNSYIYTLINEKQQHR